MDEFVPGQVYENLIKMVGYRGQNLIGEPLDAGAVVQKLNHYELVTINADRPASDPRGAAATQIILIAPDSKYSNKSGDFKKLLKGLPKMKADEIFEIMFVSEQPLTIHIEKLMAAYKLANPHIYLENYDYTPFLSEAPTNESVPPHFLTTDAEVDEFCRYHYTTRDKFPRIYQSETQAIWLGLRPGMVTRIHRYSETAGIAIVYRICVK